MSAEVKPVEVPVEEVEGSPQHYDDDAPQVDEYVPYPFEDEPDRQRRTIDALRARMGNVNEDAENEGIQGMQEDLDALKRRVATAAVNAASLATVSAELAAAVDDLKQPGAGEAADEQPGADAPAEVALEAEPEEDAETRAARAAKAAQRAAARRAKAVADAAAKAEAAQAAAALAAAESAAPTADFDVARKAAAERLRLKREAERRQAEEVATEGAARAEALRGREDEGLRAAAERLKAEKEKKEEAVVVSRVGGMTVSQVQAEAEEVVHSLMARHQAEAAEIAEAEEKQEEEAERLYAEADSRAERQAGAQLASMLSEVAGLEVMKLTAINDDEEQSAGIDSDATGELLLTKQKSLLRRGGAGAAGLSDSAAGEVEGRSRGDSRGDRGGGGPAEEASSVRRLGGEGDEASSGEPLDEAEAEAEAQMAPILERLRQLEATWDEWGGSGRPPSPPPPSDGGSAPAPAPAEGSDAPSVSALLPRTLDELQDWRGWRETSGLGATLRSLHSSSAPAGTSLRNSVSLLDRALSLPYEPWEKLAKRAQPWRPTLGTSAEVNLQALRSYRQDQIELIAARLNMAGRPKLPSLAAAAAKRTREDLTRVARRRGGAAKHLQRAEPAGKARAPQEDTGRAPPPRVNPNLSAGACALVGSGAWDTTRLAPNASAWKSDTVPGLAPAVARRAGSGARARGASQPKLQAAPKAGEARTKSQAFEDNQAARARVVATAIRWGGGDGNG